MRALIAIAFVACTADRGPKFRPAGNPTPRDGGRIRYASSFQTRTLDPTIAYDDVSLITVHALFDTLVDYEPNGLGLVPRLAQAWSISGDGLVYTFTLRPELVYSDGTPVVAADIKYSLERALSTADSPFGPFLLDVEGAAAMLDGKARDCAGITAPTERELVIRLSRVNMAFIYVMTMKFTTPQRREYVEAAGDQLRRLPLGVGPYMLAYWDEGRRLVLRKNRRYWNAASAHLDEIEVIENIARDTQFMMFERGELDSAEKLAAPDQLWLDTQDAWKPYVHRVTPMSAYGSRMNVNKKPFNDRRVRQALNYALDKEHTIKLLAGTAIPSHGMLIPGMAGRDDALVPYPHDPAKARALLAAAGYPNGFAVEYAIMADEEAERLATSLQADLAEVGVRVHITRMSLPTFAAAIGKPDGPAFSKDTWIGDFPDPTSFLDGKFHSRMITQENSANNSFYANPELDALLDAARAERDEGKRAELYRRAERILYDDAPWIWDYHQMMVEVVQPYVAGYAPHPVHLRDYTRAWLDIGAERPVPR